MRWNRHLVTTGFVTTGALALALVTAMAHARQAPKRPEPISMRSADMVSPQLRRGVTMANQNLSLPLEEMPSGKPG